MLMGSFSARLVTRRRTRRSFGGRLGRGLRFSEGAEPGAWRSPPTSPAAAARAAAVRPPAVRIAARASATEAVLPKPADEALEVEFVRQRFDAVDYLDRLSGKPFLSDLFQPIARQLVERALASDAGPRDRLILVTSPCPGEGKTFTALNLALCLSEDVNQPVLLVDGDPRTRGAARALGITAEAGLCDALTGDLAPERLVVPAELGNLAVLGLGAASHRITEALASRGALHMFRELLAAEPGRLIVIDGPSLLFATEAAALALFAGQVVLVVAAGRSSEQSIEDSLSRLGERRNLWFVLNHGPLPSGLRDGAPGRAGIARGASRSSSDQGSGGADAVS